MIKRLLIAMLSAVMVIAAVPTVAMAATENYEDNGSYDGGDGTPSQNKPADAIKEIEVYAQTEGEEITYKVTLQWGAMKFRYSYGQIWNTLSHTYGTSSSNTGWDTQFVNEANNKINIQNHSNYPVDITCEYQDDNKFGASSTVQGLFAESNADLLAAIPLGTHANVAQPYSCTLEMDPSKLAGSTAYYYSLSDGGPIAQDVYFTLLGAPQSGTVLAANTVVGKIKVTIKPAASVTPAVKTA